MSRRKKYLLLWRALLAWCALFVLLLLYYVWRLHRWSTLPTIQIQGSWKEQIVANPFPQSEELRRVLEEDWQLCPETKLLPGGKVLEVATPEPVSCRRLTPLKGSCRLAHKLYGPNATAASCGDHKHIFCAVRSVERGVYTINCTRPKECSEEFAVGFFDPVAADVQWKNFTHISAVREHLQSTLTSTKNHYGFCFIRCKFKYVEETHSDENDFYADSNIYPQYVDYSKMYALQLLVLPPVFPKEKKLQNLNLPQRINVNMLMIDSVSHTHFYRSLPLSVSKLEEVAFRTKLLDFQLMQALKHRTFESLEALFSGQVDLRERPFGTHDMPPRPLPVEDLFGLFRKAGYSTLWLEDLCWTWEWGITKDLLVHQTALSRQERYQKLQSALRKASIDELGITLASCHILEWNGRRDPFHGPPAVCFNGRHHHEYILEYLKYYQTQMSVWSQPYISFATTSVSHEDTGLRVKTLDAALADYIHFSAQIPNTVTLIFSDHGNAYGKFVSTSSEGRLEVYHPFLFMVIPKTLWNVFPQQDQRNLLTNQKKLISLLDVHHTLRQLISNKRPAKDNFTLKFVVPRGLFGSIPANRTCDDLPRLAPNMCICDKYETLVPVSSEKILLAEHAIGTLNNILWSQLKSDRKEKKSCQRLVGDKVENVHETVASDQSKIIKMDVYVSSYDRSIRGEIFLVSIKVPQGNEVNKGCHLMGFERLTSYSHFGACADPGLNLKLCLCSNSKKESKKKNIFHQLHSYYRSFVGMIKPAKVTPLTLTKSTNKVKYFGASSDVSAVLSKDHVECLHLLKRKYMAGVAFELLNDCMNPLHLAFDIELVNMISTVPLPLEVLIDPGVTLFLLSLVQLDEQQYWTWKFSIKYIPH